jgi:hypothetical protein
LRQADGIFKRPSATLRVADGEAHLFTSANCEED